MSLEEKVETVCVRIIKPVISNRTNPEVLDKIAVERVGRSATTGWYPMNLPPRARGTVEISWVRARAIRPARSLEIAVPIISNSAYSISRPSIRVVWEPGAVGCA